MGKIFGISDLPVSMPFLSPAPQSLLPKPKMTYVTKPMPYDRVSFSHYQKTVESKVGLVLKRFTTRAKTKIG